MGTAFLHGNGGGGGNALAFRVLGGTSAPSSPKENDIWVNTSTAITSYVFSATQPTGSSGMVWISVGTSSTVEFNALKKNGIQVYPIAAKQYVSGKWTDKTAKIYQGGAWKEWITYTRLISGGKIDYTHTLNVGSGASQTVLTQNSNNIALSSTGSLYHGIAFPNITLQKNQTMLRIKGTFSGDYSRLYVWQNGTAVPGENDGISYVAVSGSSGTLDVSELTEGTQYIFGFTYRHPNKEIITDLWLE